MADDEQRSRYTDAWLDTIFEGLKHLPEAYAAILVRLENIERQQEQQHEDFQAWQRQQGGMQRPEPASVWNRTKDVLTLLVPLLAALIGGYIALKNALPPPPHK